MDGLRLAVEGVEAAVELRAQQLGNWAKFRGVERMETITQRAVDGIDGTFFLAPACPQLPLSSSPSNCLWVTNRIPPTSSTNVPSENTNADPGNSLPTAGQCGQNLRREHLPSLPYPTTPSPLLASPVPDGGHVREKSPCLHEAFSTQAGCQTSSRPFPQLVLRSPRPLAKRAATTARTANAVDVAKE